MWGPIQGDPVQLQNYPQLESVEQIEQAFESFGYICSRKIATAVFLAFQLRKPILVEGPPGVGKTELAKTTAIFGFETIIDSRNNLQHTLPQTRHDPQHPIDQAIQIRIIKKRDAMCPPDGPRLHMLALCC